VLSRRSPAIVARRGIATTAASVQKVKVTQAHLAKRDRFNTSGCPPAAWGGCFDAPKPQPLGLARTAAAYFRGWCYQRRTLRMSPSLPHAPTNPAMTLGMRRALLLSGCMLGLSALGAAGRHRASQGQSAEPPNLDQNIPQNFGAWKMLQAPAQIINPQTQQILDAIYSEIVARTYVNTQNYAVMLSVAYGNDQRGGLEAHRPEVCYPAQGFTVHAQNEATVDTSQGPLAVRQLRTSLGARVEPVMYWFAMADTVNATAFDKRMVQLRTTMTGAIPDGILLRVSSIDADAARAWRTQTTFVSALLDAMNATTRARVLGRPWALP
jgi:EpsI family protein